MTKRRQFGSIRKLPSGRWQARYRDAANQEHAETFGGKADADTWLAGAQADMARGDWRDPTMARVAFATWAERWLATTVHLAPKTRIGYESILRTRCLPAFGTTPVVAIDTPAVRGFVSDLLAADVPVGTVVKARAVLRLVMATAIEGGAIKANPCDGVRVGRTRRREMVFLTPAQVEDLATAITNPSRGGSYPAYGLLVRFAAYSGLRAGEITALRVSRLDLMRGRVDVAESLSEVPGRGLVYGPTKTYHRRSVAIPRFLVDELAHLVAAQAGHAPVFTATTGGPLRWTNFYPRHYRPAVLEAGLPPSTRFHDLRHTCAALSVAQGAHPEAIKQRLGHSTITTTLDVYGHLFPELEEALTDRLDAIGRAAEPTPAAKVTPLG
jgi:integrase